MAIEKDEQGGIEFTHRDDQNEKKAKARAAKGKPQPTKTPIAPKESQEIIERGGRPVKPVENNTEHTNQDSNVVDLKPKSSDLTKWVPVAEDTLAIDTGKGCLIKVGESLVFAPNVLIKEVNGSKKLVGAR